MPETSSALLTDTYQLSMLQAFHDRGMNERAVFECFVRRMPAPRNFLLAAGLEQVVEFLESLRFEPEELAWLAGCGLFSPSFVDSLAELRFTGDVDAMAEGTVFYPEEPLLRISAPIREAQLVESRLINLLQYQTMIASKAARVRLAAPGKLLVDFGLRRAHGAEAGLLAARASYIAGLSGTATVLAGMRWGIPLYGTMAHSFVQAHACELEAFEHFARSQPERCTWLIDTYDTEAAAKALVPLAHRLWAEGIAVSGVRIDSGDLAEHARAVRRILDQGGLEELRIFASGNLDEFAVRDLAQHAPIDGFGVGTSLSTSADAPSLDCVYKLQEYAGIPRRKRSEGKATWPGPKQVYRRLGSDGLMEADVIARAGEVRLGRPLLEPVMRNGSRLGSAPSLERIRDHSAAELAALGDAWRLLDPAPVYPVTISGGLRALAEEADRIAGGGQPAPDPSERTGPAAQNQ